MSRNVLAQPVWIDERVLAHHLAYDICQGAHEKMELIKKLPLFDLAMGDPVDEVTARRVRKEREQDAQTLKGLSKAWPPREDAA